MALFGFGKKKETPAPASAPAATPVSASTPKPGDNLTSEERYTKGMELFKARDYGGAFPLLKRACPFFGPRKDKYPDGQAAMGWMYENGKGTEAEDNTAYLHYKIAAKNGNRDGMAGVVRLTAKKDVPSVDECQKALDYIKQLGTEETKSLLSDVEQKLTEALKKETAETERKQHEEDLKQIFSEGMAAYKVKDYEKALALFEKAGQQGYSTAQFCCGLAYSEGKGTAVDKAKALMWFEKAAEQGFADAQLNCGRMYSAGEGTAVDQAKALMWYERAAEQGNADAQFCCGLTYSEGEGAADKAKALMWLEKAAELGHASAQFWYGKTLYFKDKSTEVDKAKARIWCKKAADQGLLEAQVTLRAMCVPIFKAGLAACDAKDFIKALSIFEEIAELGFAAAQYNCGMMYFNGEGTGRDKGKAKMWLEKAAAQTENKEVQEQAKEALRELF